VGLSNFGQNLSNHLEDEALHCKDKTPEQDSSGKPIKSTVSRSYRTDTLRKSIRKLKARIKAQRTTMSEIQNHPIRELLYPSHHFFI
jgi:hypothetical protein